MLKLRRELVVFIREHLPSVWALELLLLMRGAPERVWSREALVSELRASEAVVAQCLEALHRGGLAAEADGDGHRYAPGAADGLCEELEAAYRERPVAVIAAISAPAGRLGG